MKNIVFALVLSLTSTCSFASCDGVGGRSKSLSISIDECERMIFFGYLQGPQSKEGIHSYQFKDECEYTKTGFTCRADGHTPFAGTTWENYTGSNIKNGKPKCAPVFYVCAKGCQREGLPKELSGVYEQSEEGQCEE